ncbi:transmembrane protein 199-like isoform X1 [Nymphalis io]|uniref:transmembrane protein 199-like isoform X1 n=1 Tax=Inachis io TaxID=171585 RepID=UPI0021689312|nr:transmembrane protein 199-like isoform X1 [Nymphalis io]
MDLKGSLVHTYIKIYPTEKLIKFLKTIAPSDELPHNINEIVTGNNILFKTYSNDKIKPTHLSSSDIDNLKKIRESYPDIVSEKTVLIEPVTETNTNLKGNKINLDEKDEENKSEKDKPSAGSDKTNTDIFLVTADIDWLYNHLNSRRNKKEDVPYLHTLLEGARIDVPENKTIKRNPVLEARCVKLRAQQEAREYRKMTKGVDNVRMRFPEDNISYQLKQLNRQLIAIGQFIISIFAGFLFGFRGVEWMVGNLDFGFRLLLGVMCALVIALAEIYFLAKKLNEELNIPETTQLGGPLKFADQQKYSSENIKSAHEKQHQD